MTRLIAGVGSPEKGGCWMVAIQQYTEEGTGWHDHPECVDPVIASLSVGLNDWLGDDEREAVIGPHLFTPIGTAGPWSEARADRVFEVTLGLAIHFMDTAQVPHRLFAGMSALEASSEMDRILRKGLYMEMVLDRTILIHVGFSFGQHSRGDFGRAVSWASAFITNAYGFWGNEAKGKELLLDLILELCAMGERKEVVPTCTVREVDERLACAAR